MVGFDKQRDAVELKGVHKNFEFWSSQYWQYILVNSYLPNIWHNETSPWKNIWICK